MRNLARSTRLNILLLLGSVVFALLLSEVACRIRVSPQTALKWDGDEDYWQLLWLKHGFSRENPRLVYNPTLGWRPKPHYRSDYFNMNSRGLRGVREYSYEKALGERRIVVLGDSFTFGSFDTAFMPPIPDDKVYTVLLEQALPGVSVINLGVDGYGTDQQLLYLREEGFKYSPDLVIASIFADDLNRAILSFRDYAKPKFEFVDNKLVLTGVPVQPPEVIERIIHPHLVGAYTWALVRFATRPIAKDWVPLGKMEVDRLNEAILNRLREEVQQHGAKLLVAVIPYSTFASKLDRNERFLEDWGRRTGVSVLLLRDAFLAMQSSDKQAQLYVGHWTPLGHWVAAEAIRKRILEEGFLW
jgi:hypothetical protein